MIILKHLTVEHFRQLHTIDLRFPQRGSILLQGPNEAGKTALLESLYFALYGFPLHAPTDSLNDLIRYGEQQASVALTLSIATTELTITRIIERGKGQHVALRIRRLGLPDEPPITSAAQANERIIAELNYLDSEALRDSYVIGQRELGRLEQLAPEERISITGRLLGLEKLHRFAEQFQAKPDDDARLAELALRVQFAELQERIPRVSEELGRIEAALDAITVVEALQEIDAQRADIDEQEQTLDQIQEQRAALKARQTRIQWLRKADTILGEIMASYDALAEARRELPELERQIAELDQRERKELPVLEQRIEDLTGLTRSFGTLERMSNDMLAVINTAKELERELTVYQELRDDSADLNEQISALNAQIEQVRQARGELDEQRQMRPQLEARLSRLKKLRQRLSSLRQREEQYSERVKEQGAAEANSASLEKVQKDVRETEQELVLVEAEAQQDQKHAGEVEKRWQQLSIRRQLEEWRRLHGLARGLADAEQHVVAAHQRQDRLRSAYDEVHQKATRWLLMLAGAITGTVILGAAALLLFIMLHQWIPGTVLGVLALFFLLPGGGLSLQNYSTAHKEEISAEQRMHDGSNEVSMMVAAREAARRMLGDSSALAQIEREVQSLGGKLPRSTEEAEHLIQQIPDNGESIADIQQQVTARRATAGASRSQVNVTMEAVAALRTERARLEEQRKAAGWDDIDNKLRADKIAIEDMQHEVAGLAGQEGMPIPVFDAATSSASSIAALEQAVAAAITAAEREIVTLDGKLSMITEHSLQLQRSQDTLNRLLEKQRVLTERGQRYQTHDPRQQLVLAREQQAALSSALQSLQDSLRSRVRALGISFGQAAISSAETSARQQLETLHVHLDSRVELQKRREQYDSVLKESQDTLADQYHRLAKLSASLGSWVVPSNPFTDMLSGLRSRCQREIAEADERGITPAYETLRLQENACKAKIALCNQEIEDAQERIAAMLAQYHRPVSASYRAADVIGVWPLVGQYTIQDRERLGEEQKAREQELQQLEEQSAALSSRLHVEGKLDPNVMRDLLARHERLLAAKKRAGLLVSGVRDRLTRKLQPRIEHYMQQLVPLLTGGRYRDVHLVGWLEEASEQGDAMLRLRVWDSVAGAYVNKSALSAGAADQLSLALRLAFAIASLPRELRAAPGFLILDEPLNNSDRARTQALARMITGETLGQHFEQILLISQSSAFESSMFPYHIMLDGGSVVESTLPTLPIGPAASSAPETESEHRSHADLAALPATPLPAEIEIG